MPNGNNKVLFGLIIRSDGFDLDCLFYKQRRVTGIKDPINSLELQLSDFNYCDIRCVVKNICKLKNTEIIYITRLK